MPDRPSHGAPHVNQAEPYARVAVIGAGAWGTALACVAAGAGREVTLWAREPEVTASIANARENRMFLSGVKLPSAIAASGDISVAAGADAVLMVAPAQHMREIVAALGPHLARGAPVVVCAKGIERDSGLLLTEVLREIAPRAEPAILSGPSFARDVATGKPTAVTIAAREGVAARLQATLNHATFRPYVTDDLAGVALGGAAKNVYAIACGMVEGAGLGESARAAALARGFAELMRLGARMGARAETLMGLSGLGDLVLTATSMSSRNFAFGVALGKGAKPGDVSGEGKPLAEGAATAPALVARARREGVELPIAEAVAAVLAGKARRARSGGAIAVAASQSRVTHMNYWLFKTEAETFSWDMQKSRGSRGEPWSGVRNWQAARNMKEMKKGDLGFFYHTGDEKRIVGIVEVIGEYRKDPTDETGRFGLVDVKAVEEMKRPVTLAEIKADKALKDMVLVKYSRLSVQPVKPEEWKYIRKMAGMKA